MRRVYKYKLDVRDEQCIVIPGLIQALHVNVQFGSPCLWCLVDDTEPRQLYRVLTHGTGHGATDTKGAKYVGTYMLCDSSFVGHVFIKE